jgi:hypothetical protein
VNGATEPPLSPSHSRLRLALTTRQTLEAPRPHPAERRVSKARTFFIRHARTRSEYTRLPFRMLPYAASPARTPRPALNFSFVMRGLVPRIHAFPPGAPLSYSAKPARAPAEPHAIFHLSCADSFRVSTPSLGCSPPLRRQAGPRPPTLTQFFHSSCAGLVSRIYAFPPSAPTSLLRQPGPRQHVALDRHSSFSSPLSRVRGNSAAPKLGAMPKQRASRIAVSAVTARDDQPATAASGAPAARAAM